MDLIVPVAGKSSRFPNVRPKWLLTHPSGNLMVIEALRGLKLEKFKNIYFVTLKEHIEKYSFKQGLLNCFESVFGKELLNKVDIVVLENQTKNQPETVIECIRKRNINGSIFIKDADNFFTCEPIDDNAVVIHDIAKLESINAGNKSYVVADDNRNIVNIVEKKVISPYFCVGGYSFKNSHEFVSAYESLDSDDSLYISHLIYHCMLKDINFLTLESEEYSDWGTKADWEKFRSEHGTLFIDLDGVLVENSGEFIGKKWGTTDKITPNVELINRLYDSGKYEVIITTARRSTYKKATEDQLSSLGIKYHRIIFDLMHCKRIVINDYSNTNPYKSCDSINIARNSSDLESLAYNIV